MTELREKAYAKLNLTPDVLVLRPDGYHDMEMVMCSVSLSDDVTIELSDTGIWSVACSDAAMPRDEKNLAWKAAAAYFEGTGLKPGLEIYIEKRIPSGAGMAGGSSDAAAVLRALNRHYGLFDTEELAKRALKVGSDVPYCLIGGCQLAQGRGEILSPLSDLPDCFVLIAKPEVSISTPELFRAIDAAPIARRPDTSSMCDALERGDLDVIAAGLCNVFEPVAEARHESVAQILSVLRQESIGAVMTGTGSACFGLFRDETAAKATAERLRELDAAVFLEKPV